MLMTYERLVEGYGPEEALVRTAIICGVSQSRILKLIDEKES